MSAPHYRPFFQPIVDLATGRIAGHEVLARRRTEDGAFESAGALFSDPDTHPDALLSLDRRIRGQAMRHFAEVDDGGFLSINIAPVWLTRLQGHDASPTLHLIEHLKLDPARIVIEVTETGANPTLLKQVIRAYRERGIAIAIDDFGAGEAHLDRIIDLEPDLVKLDMRLFKRAFRGEGLAREVVFALARLAERTGFDLVVEGVETEAELRFAIEAGARLVQGFLLARPEAAFACQDAFAARVERVRAQVFRHQVTRHRQARHLEAQVRVAAKALGQRLETPDPSGLDGLGVPLPAILRCFITDARGQQVSPNFEADRGRFRSEPLSAPCNWSWRPYFAQIVAGFGDGDPGIGHSRPYKDVHSGHWVQTFGIPLARRRILLIDALTEPGIDQTTAEGLRS